MLTTQLTALTWMRVKKKIDSNSNLDLVKSGCFGLFKCGPVNMDGMKLPKSFGPLNGNLGDLDPIGELIDDWSNRKRM